MRNRVVRTTFLTLSVLAALCFASGCDNSDPATANVTGAWVITQNFSTGTVGTIAMTLMQTGKDLVGTSSKGPVQGTVSGTAIEFVVTDEDIKTFSGTVTGNLMGGAFTENFENEIFRAGTWTAARQ